MDLSDAAATQTLCARIAAKEAATYLMHSGGIVAPALLGNAPVDDFDPLMHLNVRLSLICAQAFVPAMRAVGAERIVMKPTAP